MIDYKAVFSKVLYEEILRVFSKHGIDMIHEDDLDSIVTECVDKCYQQSIMDLARLRTELNKPKNWMDARGSVFGRFA